MTCSSCGHVNRGAAKFCEECGGGLTHSCSSCGSELRAGAKFCDECGTPAGSAPGQPAPPERSPRDYTPKHLQDKILRSQSALEGERKQVTVLFADVKGSMELSEKLDAEAWHRILDRFFQILSAGVHRFEGTVNQYTGDGIMALFGAPIAHEDHAQRACFAALELRGSLRAYANEVRLAHGVSFAVRMGINSGEVIVGSIGDDLRMDYTAQGHTVGLAARLQELAEPGTPYLSQSTATLARGYIATEDLGETEVKGNSEPVRIFALSGAGPVRTRLDASQARGFSKFVGRQAESQALDAALEQALEGNAQVVGIVAEAGIGKSRLCFEFTERCRAREIPVRQTTGVAHGKGIPFLPILQFYRDGLGISADDDPGSARQKVAGALVLADEELRGSLPLLFDFLGISDASTPPSEQPPEERQQLLVALLQRLTLARSQLQPAVLLFEDLHWFDTGSEQLLEALIDGIAGTRTLLVVNYRPEYRADWIHRSFVQQLALQPLSSAAIEELLEDLLGGEPGLAELRAAILERTAGNPFFIEEVILSLEEDGTLEGSRGSYRLARPVDQIRIPAAVQNVLAARIDRLPDAQKHVLQTGAVVGSEFAQSVLERVAISARDLEEAQVTAALADLVQAEFLYEKALYPEREYAFRHPLTRAVAYDTQLQSRRAQLHGATALALEEVHATQLDEKAALLAQHWEVAGDAERAVAWHRRAGDWLTGNPRESVEHWRRIRALDDRLPDSAEANTLRLLTRTRLLHHGGRVGADPEEMATVRAEGDALAVRLGDDSAQVRIATAYNQYRLMTAPRPADLISDLEEAVQTSDQTGSLDSQVATRYQAGLNHMLLGRYSELLRLAEQGLERLESDPAAGSDQLGFPAAGMFHYLRATSLISLERFAEAAPSIEHTELIGRQSEHPTIVFLGKNLRWVLARERGDFAQCLSVSGDMIEGGERSGNAALAMTATMFQCQSLGFDHQWDAAIRAGERTLELLRSSRTTPVMECQAYTALARGHLGRGEISRARECAEHAVAFGQAVGLATSDARVVLCQVLCEITPVDATARALIEKQLAEVASEAERSKVRGPLARIAEVRAALAEADGEPGLREELLREARELYAAYDATGHVRRLSRVLEALSR